MEKAGRDGLEIMDLLKSTVKKKMKVRVNHQKK